MLRVRAWVLVVGLVVLVTLAEVGVAMASNSTPPILVSPKPEGKQKPGHVALIVSDPGLTGQLATPIFLTVSNRRSLDRRGHLTASRHCRSRCDFAEMSRWAGHPGSWIYRSAYKVPGYWGVTPGVYYWQVYHFVPSCLPSCVEYSAIRSFRVVR